MHESLVGGQFQGHDKIKEAKRLILEALEQSQTQLTGIRLPQQELKESYQKLLDRYGQNRGGSLFYPYLGTGFGKGALVELADGSVKYDFITGIGVHYLGHSHAKVIEASIDGALMDTVMQGNLQQNMQGLALQKMLLEQAQKNGSELKHVFFTSSGAMANENALKILFQKKFPANRVLAFRNCFMGRTLALSQVTDKPAYRNGLPSNLGVDYIPFFDARDPQGSTHRAMQTLKELLQRYPKNHACMCFELVQGEGGFYPGTKDFFVKLMDELKSNDIPIFVDEIQTFGRGATLYAFQNFELDKYVDVVTIGKLSQVCATLYRADFKPKPGLISQTFTSSSVALHSAVAIVEELVKGNYFGVDGKIQLLRNHFENRFALLAKKYKSFEGPHGYGMMLAFTLFGGEPEKVKKFIHKLFENGVIAFVAGANPIRIRFLPPAGAISLEDIDTVCDVLDKTIQEMEV